MKPLSLIALFIAAGLLIIGIAGRGQGSERVLSNAVIVAASFIIAMVAVVWVVAFLTNKK